MKKNFFLSFICACVPGAGQMYQNYMKRGVSLMGAFAAVCALSWAFNASVFLWALPVLWAYSFFDAFRLRNQTPQQAAAAPDDYLFHWSSLENDAKFAPVLQKRHKLIGWGCILVAAALLYNSVLMPLVWWLNDVAPALYDLLSKLPELIVIVLLVLLGVWLLRGPKAAAAAPDDFVAFRGDMPAGPAGNDAPAADAGAIVTPVFPDSAAPAAPAADAPAAGEEAPYGTQP